MKTKAISLISGGLDSVVSTKLIMDQGIEVIGLHFTSVFQNKMKSQRGLMAKKSAEELGIKLIIIEKGMDYIDLIMNPSHGYGKNMNPCIDCRIYMLKKAKEVMLEEGAEFLITGEVLGQRPMSQRKDAINLIEKKSGLKGLILRPLSAKLFPPTIPEQKGQIDRSKLLDIAGRSREVQFAMVQNYNLKEFSLPGGGCLLTDPIFSKKFKDLIKYQSNITMTDIELLTIGRHFRVDEKTKIIVGRDKGENEKLLLLKEGFTSVTPFNFPGPSALIKGDINQWVIKLTANIIGHYSKIKEEKITISIDDVEILECPLKADIFEYLEQIKI
ncbi:MAG TPA: 7-cyano-7-deazaguanine synthase [Syntrophorhabdaceae bacterium]|nr:7-cyano-7-deazaguanine synthase [Syntrophorhabdaceae bacterium]HPU30590.1 7-cyano-7-deazaguanine synthase [Syntrophorhabdaceae bacterium]